MAVGSVKYAASLVSGLWLPPDPPNAYSGFRSCSSEGRAVWPPYDDGILICSLEPCGCLRSAERTLLSLFRAGLQVNGVACCAGGVLRCSGILCAGTACAEGKCYASA